MSSRITASRDRRVFLDAAERATFARTSINYFSGRSRLQFVAPAIVSFLVRFADFAVVYSLGLLIALQYATPELSDRLNNQYLILFLAVSLSAIQEVLGLYKVVALTAALRMMPRMVLGWTIAFAILASGSVYLNLAHESSLIWLTLWFLIGGGGLIAGRFMIAILIRHLKSDGRLSCRSVIYGSSQETRDLIKQIEASTEGDVTICGVFDDRGNERTRSRPGRHERLGGLAELIKFCRSNQIKIVIVALPMAAQARLSVILKALSILPCEIKLPARSTDLQLSPRLYSHLGSVAMIDLSDKPMSDWGIALKWTFDKIVALTAIILLAPLMAVIAAAIKLDSRGPVFFRQKRYGFNNELIEVFKFRSLFAEFCDANASRLVSKDDARVTPVGRVIRRASLDELPQLFNVLSGDLSLVGPRPHALTAKAGDRPYDEVVTGYFARHKVKPGITGWAQISGWRGETDTSEKIQKRVEHDLYYIENWSVLFDLYILIRTPFALLKTCNAY